MRGGSLTDVDEDFGVKLCQGICGLLSTICTNADGDFCSESHLGSTYYLHVWGPEGVLCRKTFCQN